MNKGDKYIFKDTVNHSRLLNSNSHRSNSTTIVVKVITQETSDV